MSGVWAITATANPTADSDTDIAVCLLVFVKLRAHEVLQVIHRYGDMQRIQPVEQAAQVKVPLIGHAAHDLDGLEQAVTKAEAAVAHGYRGAVMQYESAIQACMWAGQHK